MLHDSSAFREPPIPEQVTTVNNLKVASCVGGLSILLDAPTDDQIVDLVRCLQSLK